MKKEKKNLSDSDDAPEEVSNIKQKSEHNKIENLKVSKKRKKLNTSIVDNLLKEE
jgi:hypothetical protein